MLLSIVRENIAQDQIGHACGGKHFTSTLHKNVYGMDCPNTGSLTWKTLLITIEKMSIILRNYPGRLRVPLQSAFTAFLRKG